MIKSFILRMLAKFHINSRANLIHESLQIVMQRHEREVFQFSCEYQQVFEVCRDDEERNER